MKQIIINFYLTDKEETNITSFNDLVSNPFSIGDEINLNVDWIYPVQWKDFSEDTKKMIAEEQDRMEKTFNLRAVKIIKDFKSMRFNKLNEPTLTIDYYCEFI